MKMIGVVLVILGIVALIYGGISYSREKTLFDVGGIEATTTEQKTVPIPAIAGVLTVVGGIALLVLDKRSA